MTTEPPPDSPEHDHASESDMIEQVPVLPRWVPVLIAVVLAGLAGLAVYTGLRYRNDTIVRIVRPRRPPAPATSAPPGEPQPGASLVFPGEAGDNTPAAHPPVVGDARAVVTGTGRNIESVVHLSARRGLLVNADPADAMVYVNDVPVGTATQFSSQPYEFAQPGSYSVRIVAPGRAEKTFVVNVDPHAHGEIARIEVRL